MNSPYTRIPGLFSAIEKGSITADTTLGERVIDDRLVRLSLVVEEVDPGANPLAYTHQWITPQRTHLFRPV